VESNSRAVNSEAVMQILVKGGRGCKRGHSM
jgi:hypothetical protein